MWKDRNASKGHSLGQRRSVSSPFCCHRAQIWGKIIRTTPAAIVPVLRLWLTTSCAALWEFRSLSVHVPPIRLNYEGPVWIRKSYWHIFIPKWRTMNNSSISTNLTLFDIRTYASNVLHFLWKFISTISISLDETIPEYRRIGIIVVRKVAKRVFGVSAFLDTV